MNPIGPNLFRADGVSAEIQLLHTGIGMVNTAYQLGRFLAHNTPKRAIHFGIAGSYDPQFALGQVVEVVEDVFAELGADSPEGWLGLEQSGQEDLGDLHDCASLEGSPNLHLRRLGAVDLRRH